MTDIETIRKEFCLVGPITELDPAKIQFDEIGYNDLVRFAYKMSNYPGLNPVHMLEIVNSIRDASKAQAFTDQAEGNLIWKAKLDGVTHYIQVPKGGWKYEV